MFLDSVECKVDRIFRYAVCHAHVMFPSMTEGAAGSDRHSRILEQSNSELCRVLMTDHDFRKDIVRTVRPGVLEHVGDTIQALTDAVSASGKSCLEGLEVIL